MTADKQKVIERAKAERRHYLRVPVELSGRIFLPDDSREAHCRITDLSPGGAQVVSELVPSADTQVILYIDGFGRFEAVVARPSEQGFGVRFHCSALKRERIAEQLTVYLNRSVVDESLVRRHDRAPAKGLARFTRANGETVDCQVLDLSLGGVSLKTDVRPPLGEVVVIGHMAGKIVRHHEDGIAVEFTKAQPDKSNTERPINPFAVLP